MIENWQLVKHTLKYRGNTCPVKQFAGGDSERSGRSGFTRRREKRERVGSTESLGAPIRRRQNPSLRLRGHLPQTFGCLRQQPHSSRRLPHRRWSKSLDDGLADWAKSTFAVSSTA